MQCILHFQNCTDEDVTTTRSDLVYWTSPTVTTDQANGFTLIRDHLPGRYYYQTTTVTYTATDGVDTIMCAFDVIVNDNGSPTITSCPGDITETPVSGQNQAVVSWTSPVSSATQVSSTKNSGDLFDVGRTTVKYTFMNNVVDSFCTFDVFVNEPAATTLETITCPADIEIVLPIGVDSTPVTWDDPVYPTNIGSVTLTCGRTKGDSFFVGTNTITCVAYFESTKARMCSFNVVVTETPDDENPSILNCPANINTYVGNAETGAIVTWDTVTITDNTLTNLNLVGTHTNGDFYNIGTYDVTYTGTDDAGNVATCTFRITVQVDNLPPTFVDCPAQPLVVRVPADETTGIVTWVEPTATDNSGPVTPVMTTSIVNGATLTAAAPPAAVSYTATDRFGNVNQCDFTVDVVVDQRPSYTGCPANMVVDAEQGVNYANVTWVEPFATDDLDVNLLSLTKSHEPGQDLDVGVYIVEYTATDEATNVATCTFTVTVRDQQNPVIGPCPTAITLDLAQSQTSADVTWTNPTGTDNSGATPTITSDQPQGSYTAGDYTVIVTATDPSGNVDTCTFSIRINPYVPDNSIPTWSSCPLSTTINTDSGVGTATHSWTVPVPSDDRGVVTPFNSHDSPFDFPIGPTNVVYRATDAAGNVGECTFTVTVTDNQAPVWTPNTGCGTTVTHYVLPGRTDPVKVIITDPVATDNSGIAPTITAMQDNSATPTFFSVGSTPVTYTAMDGSSNAISSCIITVNVIRATSTWSPQGSITFTRIRGTASGSITSAGSARLLNELTSDMDEFFRETSVGAQFVGVSGLTHQINGLNTVVTFQLYFTRNGRHTSRDIMNAFNSALSTTNSFSTNNVVVANSFSLNVREFKLTTRLIGLDGADNNPPFLNNYNIPGSNEFMALANRFDDEFDTAFLGSFSYLVSTVVDMRSGSIISDNILMFDGASSATEAQIVNQFNGKLSAEGEFRTGSGLYFDPVNNINNQELCPSDECLNGGTCTVDSTYTNVCTCVAGFSGSTCATEEPTFELTPLAIALIAGGGGLLLLFLLIIFICCCVYCLQTPLHPVDQYPMKRPFHTFEDEGSVASSMDVFMLPRQRERSYLPALPPPEPPTLHLERERYPSAGPSFSPDGEVYVTGPNQVAIRPSSKRYSFY
ncbi:hyalin-like isoform X2 [Asterias amurensis]|uniref:hyalin-like isoform X2 n=1 Tax=Asterias amurensis TaxID=7602 RepID=UPI003AB56A98